MSYLEITEPLEKLPVADTDAVCAIDMGSKVFTLVCGYRHGNRIITKSICHAPLDLGADIARNKGRISTGKLTEIGAVLADLHSCSTHLGVSRIVAAATAAVGRAANAWELLDLARAEGIAMEIVNEQREGALGYLAATRGLPNRLVCKLRSQSCQVTWKVDTGISTIYLDTGYVRAYEDYILAAYSIGEATEIYRGFLKRHIRLPSGTEKLIALSASACAAFITGQSEEHVRETRLSAASVSAKLDEVQGLLKPEFDALKQSSGDMAEILTGLIFLDCLLSRTGHTEVYISPVDLPAGLIFEHFEGQGLLNTTG
jgi:exopolyphosphatase/pppGpp-phosphohydrolase